MSKLFSNNLRKICQENMQCGINKQTSITYTFGSQFLSIFFFGGGGGVEKAGTLGSGGAWGLQHQILTVSIIEKSLIMFETMQKDTQTTDNTRLRCVYI